MSSKVFLKKIRRKLKTDNINENIIDQHTVQQVITRFEELYHLSLFNLLFVKEVIGKNASR